SLLLQDPVASVIAPKDGNYVVQLRDSAYGGSGETFYRLHVGTFPRPTAVFPPGGQAGKELTVQFLGDASGTFTQAVKLPEDAPESFALFAEQNGQVSPSGNVFRVSPFPDANEQEPNDEPAKATPAPADVNPPVAFNGILEKPGDVDFVKFK